MAKRRYSKKALIILLALIMAFPFQALAYNKSWDQGHQYCVPNPGGTMWGHYAYSTQHENDMEGATYSSKDCCDLLCKHCPIYANTGRLQKSFTDLAVPGVGPSLTITRAYLSQDWSTSLLGRGWVFNLGKRLIIVRNNEGEKRVIVRRPAGEQNYFRENPDGTLELLAKYGVPYDLIKNDDDTYTIANKDGSIQALNADGKITRIVDKNGNELVFEYDSVGCLSRITNASGNFVDFQLGPNGKIASISDNLGRTVSYTYDEDGNLTASADPMGNTTQYVYDGENRLVQMVDPRGNTVFSLTYDSHQPPRVVTFSEKGETWSSSYYDGYTVKRDSAGNTWTYYYNDVGIIERIIDPLGNTKQQHHNHVTSTSMDWDDDENGNRTTYTYDGDGNIATKTDPLGNTWTYTYVADTDRMETEANPLGVVTSYEYDGNGNRTRIIGDSGGPLENATTYSYDASGNTTSATDPLGNTTAYEYDAAGNLTRVTDPLGNVTTRAYDGMSNRLTETDALGNTTTYTYDLMNRLLTITDPLGNTTANAHDGNGNQISQTNALGNTTTYVYDAYNRLIQVTDPLGSSTSYTYDSRDNRTSTTDGNGNTTVYTYNILDRLTRETNALGGQTDYTYDAAGNIVTITDACGNATTYAYDATNRRISETNAAGETTTYAYDAGGNETTVTLPNGNTTVQTFDSLGRLTALSDSLGVIGSYTYDLASRQLTSTDALGNTTTHTYDALGSIVQTTDPLGNSTAYTYDVIGRHVTITDREGSTTGYTYDAVGRTISETDPLGNSTNYTYDSLGNLVSITDALSNTTDYSYDALNRLVQETYADGTTRSFTYDAVGNLVSRTDQKGQVATYVYDVLNRQTSVDYPGTNDNVYAYDCASNIITANNANVTISLAYDNLYRLTQSVQNGQTVAFSHDTTSNRKTITYPSGMVIREIGNLRGLLTRIENASAQPIVQYACDAANRVQTKTYLNGIIGNFTNNANGWITQLTYDVGGSQILGFEYGFGNEGDRLYARKLADTGDSEQYVYDAKYRMTQFRRGTLDVGGNVTTPVTQTAYNLDALGNWTSKTTDGVTENRTHNNLNELTSIDGSPLTYDDNGNLIDDGTNTYEYDYENRLITVTRKSDSEVLGDYKYDALGRRVEKQASGTATAYYYYENRVIEEQVAGTTEAVYAYGIDIDEVLLMERAGQVYYYLSDSLGSIVALADSSGNLAEQYAYDAYGTPSPESSALNNPYMFTGRRFDREAELQYSRNRYLSYSMGRFLQRDPAGYIEGTNLYEYCKGNPINLLDALGLWTRDGVLEIICCTTEQWVIEQMSKKKIVVMRFKTATDVWLILSTGKEETVDLSRRLRGNTHVNRTTGNTEIRLNSRLSDEQAVTVLLHESEHTRVSSLSYLDEEVEVRVRTESFKILYGMPETKSGYRKKIRNKRGKLVEVPDRAFIKNDVYSSSHYNPTGKRRIRRLYDGVKGGGSVVSGPWKCP